MFDELNEVYVRLCEARRKEQIRAVKRWAKTASVAALHRVTKPLESPQKKTASADKYHRGERTDFMAAEHGKEEWGGLWHATAEDKSEDLMLAIEAMTHIKRAHPEIILPPFSETAVLRQGRKFRGNTGLSIDGMRPRHLALISPAARGGLVFILTAIERAMRWPSIARWVIANSLPKRLGGARLIGISTVIYRIWARIRYADCRQAIEERLIRPFFSAAPERGAERAAFEANLDAEIAHSRGQESATSTVDMKQFYEHITVAEFARGAIQQGLPMAIVMLSAHLYTWPPPYPCAPRSVLPDLPPQVHRRRLHVGYGPRAAAHGRPPRQLRRAGPQ
jgi:hypothetical protein